MTTERLQILIDAKNRASGELKKIKTEMRDLGSASQWAGDALFALGGMAAGAFAAMKIAEQAVNMAKLNTQIERSAFAFEHFSGGAEQAAANMRAVQRASGGTLTSFDAQNLAVTAMTQGLASTAQELERVTKVARGIVAVSPVINDMDTAFSQLALTIANQSTMRLDQLGTSMAELKPKIDDLKSSNSNLTDAMAFQIALMDTLEGKYEPLLDAAVNTASGIERLTNALREQRATVAAYFGWIDIVAGDYADLLEMTQSTFKVMELLNNIPSDISPQGTMVLGEMAGVIDAINKGEIAARDGELQLQRLLEKYYMVRDAAVQAGQAEQAAAKASAAEYDRVAAQLRQMREEYDSKIEQAGQQAFRSVYEETGSLILASTAYEQTINRINDAMRDLPENFGTPAQKLMILPSVIAQVGDAIDATFSFGTEVIDKTTDATLKLASANDMLASSLGTAASAFPALTRNMQTAQAAAITMASAVGAAFDTMSEIAGDRSGAKFGALSGLITTPLQIGDGMKAVALESGPAKAGVAAVNSEFESLKSTISGIVSGAIGPVAGVDANDLLPREDAVNENARRLADIAVNGFKGQEWLDEFAMEAPDVFEQLKNSSDPKATAAQILKDFQDGLRPDLLDKDRAKELVKRALQGDANTKQLVDEIAGELASELGISLGEAKATASEVLGGGEGATGVSLAPKIDTSAAASAAGAFAAAFNTAITDSSMGADLSGAIMTQVMASVAVIESSGNEAGKALVKGVTATFTDIPAAFIAAVASLVTPAVQASINSNGGRTGAAAV